MATIEVYTKAGTDAADDTGGAPGDAVALPVSGVSVVERFVYTNYAIARPAVPAYVSLDWVGPAGPGGVPPTNMATNDMWDMQV